jgi:protein arginine kinase activator
MLCDVCKQNEAKVFFTQIVDGKMQKVNLCEACSKAKGVTDPTGFALADLLLGLGAAQEIESGGPAAVHCPVCGFSQTDLKKTGRLGCSSCYDTFADGLSSVLKAMHKGTRHTGKIPVRLHRTMILGDRMRSLKEDLEKAVESENYESAAKLRDEIRKLESEFQT